MGASESMFDGVSGLSNHQRWMSVIGNNIANVNTSGFKDEQFGFADVISETIRGASSATPSGPGGTDSQEVGLGTSTGSITRNQQQGSLQTTNLPTDFAIQGDGFFIVSDGVANHYTRDSNFIVDGFGNINHAATGFHLQGFGLKQVGNNVSIDTSKIVNLTVPQQINPAQQTNVIDLFGNLQSSTTVAQTQSVGVYDSLGQLHNVVLTFTPPGTAGGNWTIAATSNDLAQNAAITITGGNVAGTAGAIHFNALGQLDGTVTPLNLVFSKPNPMVVASLRPPEPWLIPGTTTTTNAVQAAVQINLSDPAVGAVTAFASPTSLATQAVPGTSPLLGTQSQNTAKITGNLTSTAAAPAAKLTFNAADSNGFTHTFTVTLTQTASGTPSTWTPTATVDVDQDAFAAGVTISTTAITWTAGVVSAGGTQTITIPAGAFGTAANGFDAGDQNAAQTITLDFSKLTNTAIGSGLVPPSTGSAGNSAGALKDFSVDRTGVLHGVYTNGFQQTIGQILLANFENAGGLDHESNNLLQISADSGVVNIGTPGAGKFGTIAEGNVETSNVDLAFEFSNMILAQRGFQANSRIITTSDQMLEEVVNLKR